MIELPKTKEIILFPVTELEEGVEVYSPIYTRGKKAKKRKQHKRFNKDPEKFQEPKMSQETLQMYINHMTSIYSKKAQNYCIDPDEVLSCMNMAATKAWNIIKKNPVRFDTEDKERNYLHVSFKSAFLNMIRDQVTQRRLDEIADQLFKDGYYIYILFGRECVSYWEH